MRGGYECDRMSKRLPVAFAWTMHCCADRRVWVSSNARVAARPINAARVHIQTWNYRYCCPTLTRGNFGNSLSGAFSLVCAGSFEDRIPMESECPESKLFPCVRASRNFLVASVATSRRQLLQSQAIPTEFRQAA